MNKDTSKLKLLYYFNPLSQFSNSGDFQLKINDNAHTPFLVAPMPIGVKYPPGSFNPIERRVRRVVDCVNAMEGIEDPIKIRETWDVVKELELDAFHILKEHHESLKDKLKALFFEFCPMTPQQQELIDKLNKILDEH